MKRKSIGLVYKGKRTDVEAYVVPKWYEGIGLMFHRRESARALLFEFKKPMKMAIHSWFVFFPFIAVWLDDHDKIISVKKVKPFEFDIAPSVKFSRLLEIPLNERYKNVEFPSGKETFK